MGITFIRPVAIALTLILGACVSNFLSDVRPLPDPTGDNRSQHTAKGFRFWPASVPIEEDVEYSFNTGHCGLDYLTDFDGSFWRPINPNAPGDPPSFFFNQDQGTLTLTSDDTAVAECCRMFLEASGGDLPDQASPKAHHGSSAMQVCRATALISPPTPTIAVPA